MSKLTRGGLNRRRGASVDLYGWGPIVRRRFENIDLADDELISSIDTNPTIWEEM